MFKVHLETDYVTKKEIKTTRRGFKTKKEAQAELNKVVFEFENNIQKEDEKATTINEMYELWFDTYKDTDKETIYRQTDRRMKKYILPVFGDMIIERITPKIAQKEINKWAEKLGIYTALLNYLIKIRDYAVLLEVVDSNPFRKIFKPKQIAKKSKKKLKYYSSDQLKVFLQSTEKRLSETTKSQLVRLLDIALLRLLTFSGIRIGECLSIYSSDIDFDKNTLHIDKSLPQVKGGYEISRTKTFSSVRDITLDQKTLSILKKMELEQAKFLLKYGYKNDNSLIFSSWKGEVYYSPKYEWTFKTYCFIRRITVYWSSCIQTYACNLVI